MGVGYLYYTTATAQEAVAAGYVTVTITDEQGATMNKQITTSCGLADPIALSAPDARYSESEDNTSVRPYSVYNLRAEKEGFYTVIKEGIEVFDTQVAIPEIVMIPVVAGQTSEPQTFTFPENHLWDEDAPHQRTPDFLPPPPKVLTEAFIPRTLRVKLGTPSSSARVVSVSFVDYIKRVASAEVYPTWPVQTLRANIYAQISLVLNRIFTEWYVSRGYNFEISGSPSYDQAYTHGREIYASISTQVDDIFNSYIRKGDGIEPHFAQYCDGKTVTCAGMSQWGSKTMGDNGRTAIQILRSYYGSNVSIETTNNIREIQNSYPGSALRVGSSGDNVRTIQRQLNRIAKNYPSFGTINPVDGNFGTQTQNVVKAFQKQFKLTQDGVVGKSTWYKISYIYVSVTKLAQLSSEGEAGGGTASTPESTYPGTPLRVGSKGNAVRTAQMFLSTIAPYYTSIANITVDGNFGSGTQSAVRAFQTQFGLSADGVVGRETWNALFREYEIIQSDLLGPGIAGGSYPGTPLRQGQKGASVSLAQFYLAIVAAATSGIPVINVDGNFGSGTAAAVRAFQTKYGLSVDGVIGVNTWNKLYTMYLSTLNGVEGSGVYPGTVLRVGSRGDSVMEFQFYLYVISFYYPSIPTISYDGSFGAGTQSAVRAYQSLANLTVDGAVGPATWASIYSTYLGLRSNAGRIPPVYNFTWPEGGVSPADGTGARQSSLLEMQTALAYISMFYDDVLEPGRTNALDSLTIASMRSFQAEFDLPLTYQFNQQTWNAIISEWLGLLADEEPMWENDITSEFPEGEGEPQGESALIAQSTGIYDELLAYSAPATGEAAAKEDTYGV